MTYELSENTHILVVDDEKDIQEILQRTIEGAGIHCSVAGNTETAKAILAENSIDVVITDIVMPGASGIDLLDSVKEYHHADVIVMTGFTKGLKYEEIIEKGACDFIQKPLSPKEVLIRLKRVLRERSILAERDRSDEKLKESFRKLQRILDETVQALGSALEQRDPYTAGHQKRVAMLAGAIAQKIGLEDEWIEGIHIAGLLHDIGKISIPTDILNKPSALRDSEFALIKEHPLIGYEILKDIEFERPIAQIVIQHHEKINGSGYPYGISGESILYETQILTVADTVEAMASNRPYRLGLGIDAALDEIDKNKGILYDAQIVDTCTSLFREEEYTFT